jgi:hypothetical protein
VEKVLPGVCVLLNVPPVQLSVIVGAVQVATPWQDASALTHMSAGQLAMTGAIASTTVTLKVQVVEFPAASLAV